MLIVSRAARDDLKALYWQGLDLFGLAQADRYVDGLLGVLDLIADFPAIGRTRSDLGTSARAHGYKSHVVLYRVDDAGNVRVQRIRHGFEDWQSDLLVDGEED